MTRDKDRSSVVASSRSPGPGRARALQPSALLLAAGASSRFHGTKQLARLHGKTLVEAVLDALPKRQLRETVIVLGHRAPAVARAIGSRSGVRTVVNPDYRSGMGSSIRAGVKALAPGTPGVIVLLADQPFVTRSLLLKMLGIFASGNAARIVAASQGGVTSPPVIFPRRYFRELAQTEGDQGAKSVVRRHPRSLSLVRVRSKTTLEDVDTREDLELALRLLEP